MNAMKSTLPLCAALAILCQMAGQVPAYAEEAQPDAAAFELTPETLSALAECRAPREALGETGMVLFMSGNLPAWLKPVPDNGHEGMLGLETFELAEPVAVFGKPVTRISFLQEWVVIEDTYDAARTLIEAKGMKRAPIKMTEQYYRFADPESGPMLGAFAPTDNALAMMLGHPRKRGPRRRCSSAATIRSPRSRNSSMPPARPTRRRPAPGRTSWRCWKASLERTG